MLGTNTFVLYSTEKNKLISEVRIKYITSKYSIWTADLYEIRCKNSKFMVSPLSTTVGSLKFKEIMAILEGFQFYEVASVQPKTFYPEKSSRIKNINLLGEYAKNIMPYMANTPVDIKLSLSWQTFHRNQKKSNPQSTS